MHYTERRNKLLRRLGLQTLPSSPMEMRKFAELYASEPQRLGKKVFENIIRDLRSARLVLRLERTNRLDLNLSQGDIIIADQNPGIDALVVLLPLNDSESRIIEAEERINEDNVQRAIAEVNQATLTSNDLLNLDEDKKSSAIDLLNAAISKLVQLRDLLRQGTEEASECISSVPPPFVNEQKENIRDLGSLSNLLNIEDFEAEMEGNNHGVSYEHH